MVPAKTIGIKSNTTRMMKMMKMWMLVVVATIASACSKQDMEEVIAPEGNFRTIEFTVSEIGGRTAFGEINEGVYPVLWEGTEQIGINLNREFEGEKKRAMLIDEKTQTRPKVNGSGNSTSFSVAVPEEGYDAPYTFYAVSPASGWRYNYENQEAPSQLNLQIPAAQTATATSCDPAGMLLFAQSEPANELPQRLDLQFGHLAAYGKLILKNLPAEKSVQSVTITSSQNIAGIFTYDLDTKEYADATGKSNTITVTTDATTVWFAARPADLSNTTLTVEVTTTDATVYTQYVNLPANRKLTAGRVAKLTVDFAEKTVFNLFDIYQENGTAVGVVYKVENEGTKAYVISVARYGEGDWANEKVTTGATDQNDGTANMATLSTFLTTNSTISIPMLSFCQNLGNDWYWPAQNELLAIAEIYHAEGNSAKLDAALVTAGGVAMNTKSSNKSEGWDRYWSSSEQSANNARFVQFGVEKTSTLYASKIMGTTKYYGRAIKVVTK